MKHKLIQGLCCCALVSTSANAMQPSIKIYDINYAGSGCPRGSVSVSMTPNKGAINAVFDHFFASVSKKPSQLVKRCKLSMSLNVPKNRRVRLRQVKFRGFFDLPANSYTKIARNYRFGNETKQVSRTWQGKGFRVINQREPFNTTWSKCGKNVRLEVDSMIELKSRSKSKSQAGVDSFDHLMKRDYRGERGWKFILDYTPC